MTTAPNLLDGEIVEITPVKPPQMGAVNRTDRWFMLHLDERAVVSVQNAVQLGLRNAPQPDLALLAWRVDQYGGAIATAPDILLTIEIADGSLQRDRTRKGRIYARHGMQEYWIGDLNGERIEVCRDLAPGGYRTVQGFRRGETMAPVAFPDLAMPVEAILGTA